MPGHPYYQSAAWRQLRAKALARDAHQCTTPGCRAQAVVVDHVVPRRDGGADALSNLRSLCRGCDNRRHGHKATGRGAGDPVAVGCDADGVPLAPGHHWHR